MSKLIFYSLACWLCISSSADFIIDQSKAAIVNNTNNSIPLNGKNENSALMPLDSNEKLDFSQFFNVSFENRSVAGTDGIDILVSQMGLDVNNLNKKSLYQVMNQFGKGQFDVGSDTNWIFGLSVKLSLAPIILKGKTISDARNEAKQIIQMSEVKKKIEVSNAISDQLLNHLNNDPKIKALPPEVQKSVINQTFQQMYPSLHQAALKQIDQYAQIVAYETNEKIYDRVNALTTELTFQNISIYLAYVSDDKKSMGVMQIGKLHPEHGPRLDAVNTSYFEQVALVLLPAQRTLSSAPTGAVQLSYITNIDKEFQVRVDLSVFHARSIYTSAQNYIQSVLTMDPKMYNQDREFWNLNSSLVRTLVRLSNAEVYGVIGAISGKFAAQIGLKYDLDTNNHIVVDFGTSDRSSQDPYRPNKSADLEYVYSLPINGPNWLPRQIDFFGGSQYVDGPIFQHGLAQNSQYASAMIGLGTNVCESKLPLGMSATCRITLNYARYFNIGGAELDNLNDIQGGFMLKIQEVPPNE